MTLLHEALTYKIRGVLFDVYNQLGPMLPEKYYQEAIAIGLEEIDVTCQTEKLVEVYYRGVEVGRYFVDVWIESAPILLELKVVPHILPIHQAQAINYLKVTNADLALLVNYGEGSLVVERLPNFLRDRQVEYKWEKRPLPPNALFPELTNQLLAILHQIHCTLQPGFLHQVYRRATIIELREQQVDFTYIKTTPIYFHNRFLGEQATRLINVEDKILLATIAVHELDEGLQIHLKTHMKHHEIPLGLLANFNSSQLEIKFIRL